MNEPVRLALIGGGQRATAVYARILKDLTREVTLVGAWSRSEASARRLGEAAGVPWFTDLDKMKADTGAEAGIVNVAYGANGQVGLAAVEAGYHILAETPIADDLAEADRIIRAAEERGLKVEVAEQFHRRPMEQIKLALIRQGVFGEVFSSFNDFAGHGYHGVSVMRSYLGFDRRPLQVVGSVHAYTLAPHWSKISGERGPREETQEHGIVEFEGGRVGLYHWTNIGYDSAARWWRGSRFLAERGMGVSYGRYEQPEVALTRLGPDGEDPQLITVQRETERCDGGALLRVVAYTGGADGHAVEWRNPFVTGDEGTAPQWHDDEIAVAGCIKSLVDAIRTGGEPTYGARQARLDQEITLAIRRSAAEGGTPVAIPSTL